MKFFIALLFSFFFLFGSKASHVLGGELTWKCQGTSYVFTLTFYRDCNGAEVNTISEEVKVWNHPTLTSIILPFVERIDVSPTCSPVTGSPNPLDCGSGANAGNGIGAVEKIVYRSAPIAISGIPPAQGWAFTYENFSRSGSITNLANPSNYGITIAAKMFATPSTTSGCVDNAPIFLQAPHFVNCSGSPYQYNMNAVDPDLDSLFIDFGTPFNHFPTGIYDPPTNPIPIPYEVGFSPTSPTPGSTINPGNIPAVIDPLSGELSFTSNTIGNYVIKARIRSYRNGYLNAEVEREMQVAVLPCTGANNPPSITPPFAGSFETTVSAGSLVNFTLSSVDLENLQNGSPQQNLLMASGPLFGTNFTSSTGCDTPPCATLNATPVITGNQGVNAQFSWQTSCDHLLDATGNGLTTVPYHFVFRVQDDYCAIPEVRYATVTINVVNPGVIEAPGISCIQGGTNGTITLNWEQVANPAGSFLGYEVYSLQSGLLTTIPNIGTTSYSIAGVVTPQDYYVAVISGCNGNTRRYSDTLKPILLDVTNPSNGTAILQWNDPSNPAIASMGDFYHIYREYPSGIWTLIDSVPYGLNFYKDTIDICEAFLNYQIVLPNQPCDFTSTIDGDDFEDMLTPDIPIISSVSIDTLTNVLTLTWNQNGQDDTYGYVIYTYNSAGFLYELDTVWGISSTTYSYSPDVTLGPLSYSVAAFDSCYTPSVPPTFQTSAKALVHTTIFLTHELNICTDEVVLNWNAYSAWNGTTSYEIWSSLNGQSYQLVGTTTNTTFTADVIGLQDYCFFIKAVSSTGISSFSSRTCLTIIAPTQPAFHYLKVATVNAYQVDLIHTVDASSGVTAISFERKETNGSFETIGQVPVSSNTITFTDTDVDVNEESYTYRVRIIDSCGRPGIASNEARTILLSLIKDDTRMINYISWNGYEEFNGGVIGYNVYRGIDGVYSGPAIAMLQPTILSFEDNVNDLNFNGKICYIVDAIEGSNLFNDPRFSRSNEVCSVFEPIVYIPNAFVPDGVNKFFVPVLNFFDPSKYEFTVFDRLGRIVFESKLPNEGWDGTIAFSDEPAQPGTYIYQLQLADGSGVESVYRGHVTLVR
jgi:gliding motility-associated-like protein